MYYQPSSKQLINDADLTLRYNLRPGAHDVLLGYGFHYVYDTPPEYDWITQRLVKGDVRKINNSVYYKFPYTIEELTPEEIAINREKKRQLDWIPFREQRDEFLRESDWTQINDYALVSVEERILWATYRQALRDLPNTYPNSADIIFPDKPKPQPIIQFLNVPIVDEPILFVNTVSSSFGESIDVGIAIT